MVRDKMDSKKNYFASFLTGIGGVAVTTVIGFVSTPLSLGYWGTEKYGLWAILMSILTYLSVSNLGAGQAAQTLIAKNADYSCKKLIFRRCLFMLSISMSVMIVALLIVNAFVPKWIHFLGKIPSGIEGEATLTCLWIVVFFFVNLPFTLLSSLMSGCQKAYVENTFSFINTICNFFGLLLVIVMKGNLPWLAIINGLVTLILNIIKLILSFFVLKPFYTTRPAAAATDLGDAAYPTIIKSSLRFFLIWLAATLIWNTDNFVVSNILGLRAVTSYSITFKFYNMIFLCIFTVNNALLPLLGKEFGKGNWIWLKKNYRRFAILGPSLGGLTFLGGVLFGRDFIAFWTGAPGNDAGLGVLLALGLYSYFLTFVNFHTGVLSSFNYTKAMWIVSFAEGGLKIFFSVLLGQRFGLVGIAMGTLLGSALTTLWLYPLLLSKRSGGALHLPIKSVAVHFLVVVLPLVSLGVCLQIWGHSLTLRLAAGVALVILYICFTFFVWPQDIASEAVGFLKKGGLAFLRKLKAGR
jgi:O-antigen/teichoic acid export membrane protein